MKAVGQFAGGINAYNAGKYSRAVMQTNGQNALNAGVSERDALRERAGMVMGQQITSQGGSGFQVGSGSAVDALKQSAANRELDLLTSRMKAGNQAVDFKNKGEIAYQQGKSAMAGGIISGAMTIAEEVAQAAAGGAGGGGGETMGDAGGLNFGGMGGGGSFSASDLNLGSGGTFASNGGLNFSGMGG